MTPDFDSLFADDTPITPQEQSWGVLIIESF